ncbi:N-acetylglucosamine-induced protein [Lachnellula suecica]|uniref:N-acetylglucosamine-induced protein n=1 Tax=Lachnellula suecica TaxID=602035 RepID=A0A8T9C551_9HELO|nr:N-acetylglucosamine-induced protein [Lachnellula suecica]
MGTIPYWQVNVPAAQRSEKCPEFLATLNQKDIGIISTPDDEYHILTWPEVQRIIAGNRLDLFQRIPSDLRRYLEYNYKLKREYGSVMNFVLTQRLGWTEPIKAAGKPFEKEEDLKILWNDWPYGIDEKIVHIVVWTKFELEDDEATGDLTDQARGEIEGYVGRVFGDTVGKENVIWFKNWKILKSVHAVEHFHVMLYDPDPAFVKEITNGDVPLSQKV